VGIFSSVLRRQLFDFVRFDGISDLPFQDNSAARNRPETPNHPSHDTAEAEV